MDKAKLIHMENQDTDDGHSHGGDYDIAKNLLAKKVDKLTRLRREEYELFDTDSFESLTKSTPKTNKSSKK